MDLSFAAQALRVAAIVAPASAAAARPSRGRGDVDQEVARLKLATLGIEIDVLSVDQERYLRPFR